MALWLGLWGGWPTYSRSVSMPCISISRGSCSVVSVVERGISPSSSAILRMQSSSYLAAVTSNRAFVSGSWCVSAMVSR